jgi:hypothetical protein
MSLLEFHQLISRCPQGLLMHRIVVIALLVMGCAPGATIHETTDSPAVNHSRRLQWLPSELKQYIADLEASSSAHDHVVADLLAQLLQQLSHEPLSCSRHGRDDGFVTMVSGATSEEQYIAQAIEVGLAHLPDFVISGKRHLNRVMMELIAEYREDFREDSVQPIGQFEGLQVIGVVRTSALESSRQITTQLICVQSLLVFASARATRNLSAADWEERIRHRIRTMHLDTFE